MAERESVGIVLLGLGVVGSGVARALAEHAETYTYLAATFGDSTATGTVWSRFQVNAYTGDFDDPPWF